jgi:hypothetical protein
MTLTVRYLHILLWAVLSFIWAPALAAGVAVSVSMGDRVLAIHPVVLLLTGIFSTLSGATTLAIRINKELDSAPGKRLPRPWLYCAAHMLGSWSMGAFVFLMNEHFMVDVWLSFANVLIGSFAGAAGLESVAKRWLPGFPVPAVEHAFIDTHTHQIVTVPDDK